MKSTEKLIEIQTPHEFINEMVNIPAGQFLMGSNGWGETESPVHLVHLSSFRMDVHPVTNQQFRVFAEATKYITTAQLKGGAHGYQNGFFQYKAGLCWKTYATADRDNHPVVLVSWEDANAYCKWANKRLPTEAEWEYASRGGLENQLYPWGNEEPSNEHCNIARETVEVPLTTAIKKYLPNGYGLYDMAGNVWNLCSDYFDANYYACSPLVAPEGPESGEFICRRGGAFNIIQSFRCRCANRGAFPPTGYAVNVGFRCAQ